MNRKIIALIGFGAVAAAATTVYLLSSNGGVDATKDASVQDGSQPSKKVRPIAVRPPVSPARGEDVVAADEKDDGGKDVAVVPEPLAEKPAESDEVIVVRDEDMAQMTLANADLSPEAMLEVAGVFSQAAADEITDSQFVQALACYKPSAIVAAAENIMRHGTPEEKENALYAVGMLFGNENGTGASFEATHPKSIAIGEDGTEMVAPSSARPTKELISTVSAGFSDADAGVRDMAFNVMRTLPDEESGILAANLLSDGDVGLQERLMREAGEGEANARISLMGLGSENESVRSLAAENLKNAFGVEFSSQQEAAEWYEAHSQQFPQNARFVSQETETTN